MNLTVVSDRKLTGTYESAVGDAKYTYVLAGRYDDLPERRSLGWTVTWVHQFHSSSKSITSWSG